MFAWIMWLARAFILLFPWPLRGRILERFGRLLPGPLSFRLLPCRLQADALPGPRPLAPSFSSSFWWLGGRRLFLRSGGSSACSHPSTRGISRTPCTLSPCAPLRRSCNIDCYDPCLTCNSLPYAPSPCICSRLGGGLSVLRLVPQPSRCLFFLCRRLFWPLWLGTGSTQRPILWESASLFLRS